MNILERYRVGELSPTARLFPNVAREAEVDGSLSFPAYGQESTTLHLHYVGKADPANSSSIWFSPSVPHPGTGERALTTYLPSSARWVASDYGEAIQAIGRVTESGASLPRIQVNTSGPPLSGQILGCIEIGFAGVWPKIGRYAYEVDQMLIDAVRERTAEAGLLVRHATAVRIAAEEMQRRGFPSVEVHEGGRLAGALIGDVALQRFVGDMFTEVGGGLLQLQKAVAVGRVVEAVHLIDDTPFRRSAALRAP